MRRLAQIIFPVTLMLLAVHAMAQTTGDASVIADVAGDYHALVIGNNDYEHLGDLETAVADAEAVSRMLRENYGYTVETLVNATRRDIVSALNHLRADLTETDNLLIYYAGHGILDRASGRGYWLPVDAEKDNLTEWISVITITDLLRTMSVKHVLVVADSCYSGTLTRASKTGLRVGAERLAWLKRVAAKRARTALTSGGLEPVLDKGGGGHSVFAKAFLEALGENGDVLEGQKLFERVRGQVALDAPQTPQYADIREAGHEDGEFLFIPVNLEIKGTVAIPAEAISPVPPAFDERAMELKFWESIEESDDPAAFEAYLKKHPDGHFADVARSRIKTLKGEKQVVPVEDLREQVRQKAFEFEQLTIRKETATNDLALAREELVISADFFKKGLGTKTEYLKRQRIVVALEGELKTLEISISRAASARNAAENRLSEQLGNIKAPKRPEIASEAGETQVALVVPPKIVVAPMDTELVAVKTANLRAGPSTDYEKVGKLSAGDHVTVTGKVKDADWYRVEREGRKVAFVFGPLLKEPSVAPTPVQPAVGIYPVAKKAGDTFKDCPECPEMVVIPAGSFTMGSPANEKEHFEQEGPQHSVRIPRSFSLGMYEVTFAEWDACVLAGGCSQRPGDEGWGRGQRPVINVSWDDAKEYVRWLSRKTGKEYCLPSEAEWEYAARAGTTTAFHSGESISTSQANFNYKRRQTIAVGSFSPNGFGVYDMYGNVWEWVEDCGNDSYRGAPTDGSAWTIGDCTVRVMRGGSWGSGPRVIRAAHRSWYSSDGRYNLNGFRVSRNN